MKLLVAGSGPAGVFAALGALEAGHEVLMIDPGLMLEPEPHALKASLARTSFTQWSAAQWAAVRQHFSLHRKRVFGSDFSSREVGLHPIQQTHCQLWRSQALGGLSNLWGRGIEPPYGGEANHWPFHTQFEHALRTVLAHLPLSAEEDNLATVMPVYHATEPAHPITPESQALLTRWAAHGAVLNRRGIHFGKSRLALYNARCVRCSLCFYGCAYDAMFDTSAVLATLRQHPKFEYRPGWRVANFMASDPVKVEIQPVAPGIAEWVNVDKLLLATGAVETTRLVMQATGIQRARMKNSDMLRIPFLRLWGGTYAQVPHHSLSQLTLTFRQRWLARKAVVLHLFGRNPLISQALPGLLRSVLAGRLFIGMAFLHSDDSARILWNATPTGLQCRGNQRWRSYVSYAKLLLCLLLNTVRTGLLPLPCPGSITLPGASVHVGASLVVDEHGALQGHPSVHIADAAALPEIPAGSYTLSIMANAYRIGNAIRAS